MCASVNTPNSPFAVSSTAIESLCAFLDETVEGDSELLCQFAGEFFSKAPRQLLQERSIEDLAALTRGAFRFLQDSRTDTVNVEILNPEQEGWSARSP